MFQLNFTLKFNTDVIAVRKKGDSNFYTQMQTQRNLMGVSCPCEDQICYDKHKDIQPENQRGFK